MRTDQLVYVVDDEPLVRSTICSVVEWLNCPCTAFASGDEFLTASDDLLPGCVLLDLRMPGVDGLQVLEALGEKRLKRFVVVMMTGDGDIEAAVRAMKLGAVDFLQKPIDKVALSDALKWASAQLRLALDASAARERAEKLLASLSPRECDVLEGLVLGLPNKEVAHRLNLSIRTVEMHRSKLMERLGTHSISGTLQIAFAGGFADARRLAR